MDGVRDRLLNLSATANPTTFQVEQTLLHKRSLHWFRRDSSLEEDLFFLHSTSRARTGWTAERDLVRALFVDFWISCSKCNFFSCLQYKAIYLGPEGLGQVVCCGDYATSSLRWWSSSRIPICAVPPRSWYWGYCAMHQTCPARKTGFLVFLLWLVAATTVYLFLCFVCKLSIAESSNKIFCWKSRTISRNIVEFTMILKTVVLIYYCKRPHK